MLNKIIIAGRLTRDPELRQVGDSNVANFTVAVDRDYRNKEGERDTDFIDCVAWGHTADFVSNYFTKGRVAIVEGRLQIRRWNDNGGNARRNAEIRADNVYFGDSKRDDDGSPAAAQPVNSQPSAAIPEEDDGELPF